MLSNDALGPELRHGTFRTRELLAEQLAGPHEAAVAPLRDALDVVAMGRQVAAGFDTRRPVRLALAVDQLERLFIETDDDTAAAFAGLLAALVHQQLIYLILVLRSDAYARFQSFDALLGLRRIGATFDLVPPNDAELEEIVRRPVAACDPPLAFERKDGRSLASQLVADTKGGDALPLLQMTLSRLFAAEATRGDGTLRFDDYRGMDAAVTEVANEALNTLGDEARAELPSLIAGLVADVVPDPLTGNPTPIVVALDRQRFEARKPARAALIDAFVSRFLLTSEGDGVSRRVRPVHEALLRIWPQAVAIVAEIAQLIRARHTLEPIVRDWRAAGESAKLGHLELSPALLDSAQRLLERFGDDLPVPMRDFITQATALDAARRDRERDEQERRIRDARALAEANRRTAQRTLVGLAAAVVFALGAGWQWHSAETQRAAAQRSLELATQTANSLVFNLAQKFQNIMGVPAAVVKDILDQARKLQDQLLESGQSSPELRRSQGNALVMTVDTLLTVGDTRGALAAATQARDVFETLLKAQPANAGRQDDLSVSSERVGDVQVAQGRLPEALQSYHASLAIADSLVKSDPGNAVWQLQLSVSYKHVGDVQVAQGHLHEALQSYQAAFAIIDRLAKSDPGNAGWQSDLSVSYEKVADVQEVQGHLPEALQSYQAAFAIIDRLAKSDPGNAGWQSDLSVSYEKVADVQEVQGHLPEALQSYQASLTISDRLARSDPGNAGWQRGLAVAYERVGNVQAAQGHLSDALQSDKAAFAIIDRLAKSDPGNAVWQRDLSFSYGNIGDVQVALGYLPEALQSYQASLAIADRLAKSDPGNVDWQRDLSVSYNKVGDVQAAQGHLPAALQSYQASLAIADRLAKSDPGNVEWQRDLSVSNIKVGDVQMAEGRLPAALQSYQASLAIADRPQAEIRSRQCRVAARSLGIKHQGRRRADGRGPPTRSAAILSGELAKGKGRGGGGGREGGGEGGGEGWGGELAIADRLAKSDPGNAGWQRDLSVAYARLAEVCEKTGQSAKEREMLVAGRAIVAHLTEQFPDWSPPKQDLAWFDTQIAALGKAQQ